MLLHLTTDQLRRIVFETSIAYARALGEMSVQAAELIRADVLKRELDRQRQLPTPIFQVRDDDCWTACIATLTGIPLDSFPAAPLPIARLPIKEWRRYGTLVVEHCEAQGWGLVTCEGLIPEGFAIAIGPGPRDLDHAVVVLDGKLWHDPYRGHLGIKVAREYEIVVPLATS